MADDFDTTEQPIPNGWEVWKNHVLIELERNEKSHEKLEKYIKDCIDGFAIKLDDCDMKLDAVIGAMGLMSFKNKLISGCIGALVGLIPSIIALVIVILSV